MSKYGIVLVAAVTVATVAQSQFGQSSSKVYADEIASTVPTTSEAPSTTPATSENVSTTPAVSTSPETSEASAVSTTPATSEAPTVSTAPATSEANLNNYRMFYIKDSFYPNLKDYMGFAGRVTTADKPYTVEKGSTLPEYPYYTIVGSDGKTYSVGDTITINNPLVNHPDENDNVLHYYYYPFNPNSVSEAPAVSTAPATSETPAVSTAPATSEAPAVSVTPATSEAPAVSTTPATSEAPAVSTAPATSEAPVVSTTPATSEAPAVSTTPAASTTPATSEAPAVSTAPATSEAPAVSTTPATSEAPAASTTPAVTPSTSVNPASSVTLDKLSQKAYKKMSSAQRWASVSSPLASKADHSMDSAMISSTQSHDEGMTPATDGNLVGHNLPNTGDTNAKVGILGMIFVGLGLTSLAYKGRHRRSK